MKQHSDTKIEEKIAKENRQKLILEMLSGVTVISLAVFAPGALRGVAMLQKYMKGRSDPHNTYRAFKRLSEKGFIAVSKSSGKTKISITEKGRVHLSRIGGLKEKKPSRWDGYWRVVIYDIDEKKRVKRMRLRETLQNTGFYRLQDSVWIYPYPCEELVVLLKADFRLGKEVLYMAVKHLENDKKIKEIFGISGPQ